MVRETKSLLRLALIFYSADLTIALVHQDLFPSVWSALVENCNSTLGSFDRARQKGTVESWLGKFLSIEPEVSRLLFASLSGNQLTVSRNS